MELDRATGVLIALRRCTTEDASDELLAASERHRVPPGAIARALVALAEGNGRADDPANHAVRYEWGTLMNPTRASANGPIARARQLIVTVACCPAVFAQWVRGDYPRWSSRRCHVAAVALCGQHGSLLEETPRPAA